MCTGKRQTHIRNAPSSRTAVTGIGLYGHAGKCIRIRRRFSIIRCILPGGAEPRPYQLRLHFNGFCVKQTVYGLKLMTLPGGEALGAPAPVHQSSLHEKEVPLPAGPLFLVLNRSYRFGTITARKRVTEPVWLRMEWVWLSAQNSASPTCSSRLSPSSVTVAAPSRM